MFGVPLRRKISLSKLILFLSSLFYSTLGLSIIGGLVGVPTPKLSAWLMLSIDKSILAMINSILTMLSPIIAIGFSIISGFYGTMGSSIYVLFFSILSLLLTSKKDNR